MPFLALWTPDTLLNAFPRQFLGPNAKAFVENTLGEKYNYSLGVAATVRISRA